MDEDDKQKTELQDATPKPHVATGGREFPLRIDYQSESFPPRYGVQSGTLPTSWDELLWAAITIGRPSIYHVFRHGASSVYEALFRLSLIRMAVEQSASGRLRRTGSFTALDPTEKGMVSYFLGMTICRLFASRLLRTHWLLHIDVYGQGYGPPVLGRSRPDLFGQDDRGRWHAFECKGRSAAPSSDDKARAKSQAQRLVSVRGTQCSLHVGSFAYFNSDGLEFYWRDPEADEHEPIRLPGPRNEWRYYYEPALGLALVSDRLTALEKDVSVEIHPKILELLIMGQWEEARRVAKQMRRELIGEGYKPDGLRIIAGASWSRGHY